MYDGGSGNRTRATLVRGKCSDDCANPALCMYVWPPYFAVILRFFHNKFTLSKQILTSPPT